MQLRNLLSKPRRLSLPPQLISCVRSLERRFAGAKTCTGLAAQMRRCTSTDFGRWLCCQQHCSAHCMPSSKLHNLLLLLFICYIIFMQGCGCATHHTQYQHGSSYGHCVLLVIASARMTSGKRLTQGVRCLICGLRFHLHAQHAAVDLQSLCVDPRSRLQWDDTKVDVSMTFDVDPAAEQQQQQRRRRRRRRRSVGTSRQDVCWSTNSRHIDVRC